MRSYSKILIYAAILALTISLAHAAKPEVSFSLSSTEVLLGDSVILTITVRGVKNPSTPHIPAINGFNTKFRGVRQESFSSFSLVIQGKQIKKESSGGGYNFDYELVPQRAGVLQVPSLAIVVDGRTYNMQKFSVKVLDRSQKSEDLFIKIVTDRTRVYLGEKLLVTFKWYVRKNVEGYRLSIPWLDGLKNFLVADPEIDKNRDYQRLMVNGDKQVAALKTREVYNGQDYTVISFQKILTPIAAGNYSLEPVFLKCDVVTGYKRNSGSGSFFDRFFDSDMDGFFGTGRQSVTEPFATRSKPLDIEVMEIPSAGRPAGYSGAVGDFDFSVDLRPTTLKAGEPITITMKVAGSGNIEEITLPQFPQLGMFKSYEPESRTEVSGSGGRVRGSKIFERVLVPKAKGAYVIPAVSFVFFNPETGKYQTVKKGPFKINVEEGRKEDEVQVIAFSEAADERSTEASDIRILERDIRYIKSDILISDSSDRRLFQNRIIWFSLYLIPPLIFTVMLFLKRRSDRLKEDVGFARSRKAGIAAKRYLKAAGEALETDKARDFYDALSKGLSGYIADKFNRAPGTITYDSTAELLKDKLDADRMADIRRLYDNIEMALFSSIEPEKDILEKDYESAQKLISFMERRIR